MNSDTRLQDLIQRNHLVTLQISDVAKMARDAAYKLSESQDRNQDGSEKPGAVGVESLAAVLEWIGEKAESVADQIAMMEDVKGSEREA